MSIFQGKTSYKIVFFITFSRVKQAIVFFFSRVKQAIVKKEEVVTQLREQYNAAQKRADHLEGLLQQQRKQLLSKK